LKRFGPRATRSVPEGGGTAHYLVTATPREDLLAELARRLEREEFVALREQEDYCRPPLAQEREAVLDRYFDQISVEPVVEGTGRALIEGFPPMFPARVRP
jgi:hypothetical protein